MGKNREQKEVRGIMNKVLLSLTGTAVAAISTIGYLSASPSYSDEIGRAVDNAIKSNPYIGLMVGQDSYVYLAYNKKGEAIAESSDGGMAFYLGDDHIVTVSDTEAKKAYDLDTLDFIKNAAVVADEQSNRLNKSENNSKNKTTGIEVKDLTSEMLESVKEDKKLTEEDIKNFPKYNLYTVNLRGIDTIKRVYEKVDAEYAKESVDTITSSFEGIEPKDINMVLRVRISTDGDLGAACEFEIGEETYTSWVFTSYMKTIDWELGDDWYNTDIEDYNKWVEMVTNKVSEVSGKLLEFVESERAKNDSTRTGKVEYKTYSNMTEAQKIKAVKDIIADLKDLGTKIEIDEKEFIRRIDKYYESEDTREVRLLQAAINIGVRDGLIDVKTGESAETTMIEDSKEDDADNTVKKEEDKSIIENMG